jgi:amino-acid N-acetyltransferase
MIIRHPYPHEVETIRALFAAEVAAGLMLPRSPEQILRHLDDWLVAEEGGEIVGCVSLVFFNGTLAEVRSLAVRSDQRGRGIGSRLIEAALSLARQHGVRRVLTLTRAAGLFERLGFVRDTVGNFPEKVWRDCAPCPFRHRCDEIALVLELVPGVNDHDLLCAPGVSAGGAGLRLEARWTP